MANSPYPVGATVKLKAHDRPLIVTGHAAAHADDKAPLVLFWLGDDGQPFTSTLPVSVVEAYGDGN